MKWIKYCTIITLALSFTSCKKWLDINTDPVNPQVGSAEVLLSPIQFQMANNLATDYRVLFKYTQYWGSQAADNVWEIHGYEPANDNGGSIWRMLYVNHGPNLELMINDGKEKGKWTYAGIGYAIKAWGYQVGTDYHGPIILDQALDTTRLFFNYQDQPDVYARVREWADSAIACFSRPDAIDYSSILAGASGDQLYKGKRELWTKFVYGLLALHYGHLTNKPAFKTSYADSVVKYADLSFANATEDATIGFSGTNSSDGNPFGPAFGLINPTTAALVMGRVTQPIVSLLTGGVRGTPATEPTTSNDPRLVKMIAPNTDGVYRGVIPTQGDPATTKRIPHVWGSVAAPFSGKYFFADKARFPIMTYAQLQFAKAEALYLQEKKAEALAAYKKGIEGHMAFVNLYGLNGTPAMSATQINAYMSGSEVAQAAEELTIADIMSQKFIAQWGWGGIEQWCDLRKYDYDVNVFKNFVELDPEELFPSNMGKLAQRIRPRFNSEYVWNRSELERWGALDADYNTKELWFTLP